MLIKTLYFPHSIVWIQSVLMFQLGILQSKGRIPLSISDIGIE